jgi:glutaredoxin
MTEVTLYGRRECHLCDEARQSILDLADELGDIELREVDIEKDETLHREYLERIPVVSVRGAIVSELVLDVPALRNALVGTLRS